MLLAGCTQTWQTRFHKEYNWNKPIYRTPLGIQVAPPVWLDKADYPKLFNYIDTQVKWLVQGYPWAKNFDFGANVIWIHDAPVAFIAGTPAEHAWALGWAVGKYVVVSWTADRDELGKPVGPATQAMLPALIHEYFHLILKEQYGWADPGHCYYYPSSEVRSTMVLAAMNAQLAKPIEWSKKTVEGFRKYKYMPWLILN